MLIIQNKEVKIAIVNVYFGTFPKHFPLWLKSAAYNPHIDFLIFSDAIYEDLPGNVRILPFSMEAMKRRAEENLGFAVTLDTPYKCCDYKVTYGVLFQEELRGYDYWGHCDLDLIWGDLETCFVENHLTKYDRFFHLGHLSLYKNQETVNNYFKLPGALHDYREVFTSSKSYAFDELNGVVQIYLKNGFPMFAQKKYADISKIYRRFRLSTVWTITDEVIQNYHEQVFLWKDGHVFRLYRKDKQILKEEFAYIHLQKRKNLELPSGWQECSGFAITDTGICGVDGLSQEEILTQYAHCRGRITEWLEYYCYKAELYRQAIKRRLSKYFG